MKKVLALALALCMVLSFCAISASADGKTVINVMSFTDEVPGMITKYMEAHPDVAEKYEVKTTITATTDGLYQPARRSRHLLRRSSIRAEVCPGRCLRVCSSL